MADLSQVIQQGTERASAVGPTLAAQGQAMQGMASQQTQSVLQTKSMQMQQQNFIDTKANALAIVAQQKKQQLNSAQDLLARATKDNKTSEIVDAKVLVDQRQRELSNYIVNISNDPKIMAILGRSSLGTKNIQTDFFNHGNLSGATDQEKQRVLENLASIAQTSGDTQQKLTPFETSQQHALGKAQGEKDARDLGLIARKEESKPGPTSLGLSQDAADSWYADNGGKKLDSNLADIHAYYVSDIQPFQSRIVEFNRMSPDEREFFGTIFKMWSKENYSGKSHSDANAAVKDASTKVHNYVDKNDTLLSPVGNDTLTQFLKVLSKDNADRLGLFIHTLDPYVSPREKTKPTVNAM
jgi:hypothetical protein